MIKEAALLRRAASFIEVLKRSLYDPDPRALARDKVFCQVKKRPYVYSSTVSPFLGLWVVNPYFPVMDALSASADSSSP